MLKTSVRSSSSPRAEMHWWNKVDDYKQFSTESCFSPADDSTLSVVQTSCFPGRVKSFWCGYNSPGGRFSRAATCCSPTPWVEEECWRWETFCSRAGRPARSQAESETGREQVRENCGAGRMLLLQNWDLHRQPWRRWCLASPTERLAQFCCSPCTRIQTNISCLCFLAPGNICAAVMDLLESTVSEPGPQWEWTVYLKNGTNLYMIDICNGSVGIVVTHNPHKPIFPLILVEHNFNSLWPVGKKLCNKHDLLLVRVLTLPVRVCFVIVTDCPSYFACSLSEVKIRVSQSWSV